MAEVSVERSKASAVAVANPAALGLSAFGLTTFVLSASNAGFIFPKVGADGAIVLGLAIFYGGLGQLIAGILSLRGGNTFAGTAFCSYGGFWLAFVFTVLPMFTITAGKVTTAGNSLVGMLGPDAATGVGVFLLGWTIFTLYMFVGTFRLNGALIAVFFFLLLTFVALTTGWLLGGPGGNSLVWIQIGGWLGIITSLLAWYTGAAFVLADVNSSVKLPLFPRS